MALITCPDCGASISDKAPACLKCGYPVKAEEPIHLHAPAIPSRAQVSGSAHENRNDRGKVYTTQRTGKDVKIMSLFGWTSLFVAAIIFFNGTPDMFIISLLIGVGLLILSRIISWWKYS
ncbi:zinc ribbon domain-containing protein [Rhodanobacter glycinis]|uniref:Zinc ribbon domain-containing protein n=1 Tax=Rhodanobacter glycinis TaxID=582702 RepID=A0A5B9E1L3_9GAMM|nr:zinc ribbon domain-containing protein [Rhodanobacter glycinis]